MLNPLVQLYFSIINLIIGTIFTVSYSFRLILIITRKYLFKILKYKSFILLISRLNIICWINWKLDLEKVVVYSTLGQLGFIIRMLSIGSTLFFNN